MPPHADAARPWSVRSALLGLTALTAAGLVAVLLATFVPIPAALARAAAALSLAALAAAVALGLLLARRIGAAAGRLAGRSELLARAVALGRLGERLPAEGLPAELAPVVASSNAVVKALEARLEALVGAVERLSRGDLPPRDETPAQGGFEALRLAQNRCVASIQGLVDEVSAVIGAARAGDLARRCATGAVEGDFRKVLAGINAALDALGTPVAEAGEVLVRMADRDLTARMTGRYQGEHRRLAEAINATGVALSRAVRQVAEAVTEVSAASHHTAAAAEEVRTLALRSKEAAGKTDALIRGSVRLTDEGRSTSEQVVSTLGEIDGAVKQVTEVVARISASAQEQAEAIVLVGEGVQEATNLLRAQSSAAEQTAAVGEELAAQATELEQMVKGFRYSAGDVPVPAPQEPAATQPRARA
jgi:methyl-accepting chemotaxis protein